jgi:hypothetical protein
MYSQLPSISGGRSSIHNPRTRHAVVTGTHLSWSPLTPREEKWLKAFENKVLRRISGRTRRITGGWRKLHNVYHTFVIFNKQYQSVKIKKYDMGRHISEIKNQIYANKISIKNLIRTDLVQKTGADRK